MQEQHNKMDRAKKRVEQLKGFYIHLLVYLGVNIFILVSVMVQSYNAGEALLRWPSLVTPFFWGIGLAFHAANVFRWNPFFGKNWEERQIKKYMDKDRKESEKFK